MIENGTLTQLRKSKKEIRPMKVWFFRRPTEGERFTGYDRASNKGRLVSTSRVKYVRSEGEKDIRFKTQSGSLYRLELE